MAKSQQEITQGHIAELDQETIDKITAPDEITFQGQTISVAKESIPFVPEAISFQGKTVEAPEALPEHYEHKPVSSVLPQILAYPGFVVLRVNPHTMMRQDADNDPGRKLCVRGSRYVLNEHVCTVEPGTNALMIGGMYLYAENVEYFRQRMRAQEMVARQRIATLQSRNMQGLQRAQVVDGEQVKVDENTIQFSRGYTRGPGDHRHVRTTRTPLPPGVVDPLADLHGVAAAPRSVPASRSDIPPAGHPLMPTDTAGSDGPTSGESAGEQSAAQDIPPAGPVVGVGSQN